MRPKLMEKGEGVISSTVNYGKSLVDAVISYPRNVWDVGIVRGTIGLVWDLNDATVAFRKDILGIVGLR